MYRNGNHIGGYSFPSGSRGWTSSYFGMFATVFAGGYKGSYEKFNIFETVMTIIGCMMAGFTIF